MSVLEVIGFATGRQRLAGHSAERLELPYRDRQQHRILVLFSARGLYAEAALQVLFGVIGLAGWWSWLRGGARHTPLRVQRQPQWGWPAAALGVAVAAFSSTRCWPATPIPPFRSGTR